MKIKLMDKYEPQVFISKNAYDKTMEYINQSTQEVGWLATAIRMDRDFCIHDTYLFKQEVNSVTTEIKEDGLNEFAMELMKKPEGVDIWNNMRVWGHSHVDMGVSPSGQDNNQMKLFLDNPNDFFIRIIGNKKEEFKIDIWDFESGIIYEDADFTIVYDKDTENVLNTLNKQIKTLRNRIETIIEVPKELKEEIKKELSEKVKEKKWNTYGNNYKGYNAYSNLYDDYEVYGGYGGYNGKKKETKNEIKSINIDSIFDSLSVEEIFTIMEGIDEGYSSSDMLTKEKHEHLSNKDFEDLDDMICDYSMKNYDRYAKYIIDKED